MDSRDGECNGQQSQKWRFDPGSWQLRFAGDTTKCIDVPGSDFKDGNQLWVWECNGQSGQYWGYDVGSKTIYATNSLTQQLQGTNATDRLQMPLASVCMDLYGGQASNGGLITTWHCDNEDNNQKWDIVPAGAAPGPDPGPAPAPAPGPAPAGQVCFDGDVKMTLEHWAEVGIHIDGFDQQFAKWSPDKPLWSHWKPGLIHKCINAEEDTDASEAKSS